MRRIVGLGVRGGSLGLFPCTVKSREIERHVPFLHGVDLSTLYASPGQTTWGGPSRIGICRVVCCPAGAVIKESARVNEIISKSHLPPD